MAAFVDVELNLGLYLIGTFPVPGRMDPPAIPLDIPSCMAENEKPILESEFCEGKGQTITDAPRIHL